MKKTTFILLIYLVQSSAFAQKKTNDTTLKITKPTVVQASCGQCQFGLKTKKGCDLAIRIDSVAYFVNGTNIDDHGDAHANNGFCNAIRKVTVQGAVVKGVFLAKTFTLLKESTQ